MPSVVEVVKVILTCSLLGNLFMLTFRWHSTRRSVTLSAGTRLAVQIRRSMPREKVRTPRLTDIVVPLPPKHYEKVVGLLRTWVDYPPCYHPSEEQLSKVVAEEEDYFAAHGFNLGHDVTLTFFVSSPQDTEVEARLMEAFDRLPSKVRHCFSRARVHFAGLMGDDDGYWKGTTLMFERLLLNKVGLRWPHYVFYMEPDMLPIRPYWLAALDASVREPVPSFWMRGSIFKGQPFLSSSAIVPLSLHINGNAIYNLADSRFRDFYLGKVYNISRNDYKSNHAYDLDMYFYLCYPGNYAKAQTIAHKFQYTELIQNLYHTEYSVSALLEDYPNAYLVHGGYKRP